MPLPEPRIHLDGVIERTLRAAAHRNEMRIAWVRVLALSATVLLYFAMPWVRPDEDYRLTTVLGLGLVAWAAGVLMALRRGRYEAWFRLALPLGDAVTIGSLHAALMWANGPAVGMVPLVNTGLVCALLAMTGGLRLSWDAVVVSTASAMVTLTLASAHAGLGAADHAWQLASLSGIGLLAWWMTRVVRQAVQGEIGRTVLARFLPPEVVEEAHANPLALLGEPRSTEATVLVSDIRGFTTLCESMDPADALAFLNILQGTFAAAVHDQGGTVDKFLGDGMLAVFGVPSPLEDHADRALGATLQILRRLRELNAARGSAGLAAIQIGVALHSGPVVAGILGAGRRLEFTVIGDTVNTASRLEGRTKEAGVEVLVSGATKALLSRVPDGARLDEIGEVLLRGRRQPVVAWGLTVE